jgi:hypothetical protein
MDHFERVFDAIVWALIGLTSGLASYFNKVLNHENVAFEWTRAAMRGFIGMVVGSTLAYVTLLKLGSEWSIPAASIGAWFATETMNTIQKFLEKGKGVK